MTIKLKSSLLNHNILLLLILCVASIPNTTAQTYLSQEHLFYSNAGSNVIIRENSAGLPIIHYSDSYGTNFIYGDLHAATARNLTIHTTMGPTYNSYYTVNDMEVVGDTCYFCGVHSSVHFLNTPPIIDSIGFVGKFYLPASRFGTIEGYEIWNLPRTKCMNRMTVCKEYPYIMISMIGRSDSSIPTDCLAMVKFTTPGGGWLYDLRINSDPDERFTDIDHNAKEIAIASRRTGQDEENYVYLRTAEIYDVFFFNDCSNLNTRNQYQPSAGSNPSLFYSMNHTQDADIRLCAVPWNSYMHLAYECTGAPIHLPYATTLCRVETNGMHMDNLQIIEEGFAKPNTLLDMKYVYNSEGEDSGNTVAILHQTDTDYKSFVEYPFGLISDYSAPYLALVQKSKQRCFSSISVWGGNDIRLGGIEKPSAAHIAHLRQVRQYLGEKDICILNSNTSVAWKNTTLIPSTSSVPMRKHTNTPLPFVWNAFPAVETIHAPADLNCYKEK